MQSIKNAAAVSALAVASLVLAGCASASAPDLSPTPTEAPEQSAATAEEMELPELIETTPISVDEYVAAFGDATGWSGVAGVQEEYRQAAASFPLPLPDGYGFPADLEVYEDPDEPDAQWEAGNGTVQAFFFWSGATATAAYAAHERGDAETAANYLDIFEEGWASPVRSMYVDPESPGADSPYILHALPAARGGNFDTMLEVDIYPFLDNPANRAIATAAGDVV